MRVTDPEGVETRALASIVDFTGKSVLEIGCGAGRLTWRYAGHAASVVALDPNIDDIRAAKKAIPARLRSRVTFRVGDVTTDPLPPSVYDMAILSYSL